MPKYSAEEFLEEARINEKVAFAFDMDDDKRLVAMLTQAAAQAEEIERLRRDVRQQALEDARDAVEELEHQWGDDSLHGRYRVQVTQIQCVDAIEKLMRPDGSQVAQPEAVEAVEPEVPSASDCVLGTRKFDNFWGIEK